MDRRSFLKLIALGIASHDLDLDALLWVPGQKKIFIPPANVSISEIVAVEMERIIPKLQHLFERDDYFYSILKKQTLLTIRNRRMSVPMEVNNEPNSRSVGRNVELDKDNRDNYKENRRLIH